MKKFLLLALLLTVVFGIQAQNGKRLLVTYFSWSGSTATLAKELLEGKEYETIALTDYRINFYGQKLDSDQFDEVYKK